MADRTVVLFGNSNPQMQVTRLHPETGEVLGLRSVPAAHLTVSQTEVSMREGFDDAEEVENALSTDNDRFLALIGRSLDKADRKYAIGISEVDQVVGIHTAGGKPDWVYSSNPAFAKVLGKHFDCPVVGEPPSMLVTNGGRDAMHNQLLGTSAQPAAFNYMGITTDATAAAAGDTTLTSEETTNGLARAQATFAHTTGTNTSTLTKTFTYTGASSKVLAKIGIFNASSSGTMGIETVMSSTATVTTSGDNVTVTETFTA